MSTKKLHTLLPRIQFASAALLQRILQKFSQIEIQEDSIRFKERL